MTESVVTDRTHSIVVTEVAANGCNARARPKGPETRRWRLVTESYWVDRVKSRGESQGTVQDIRFARGDPNCFVVNCA